MSDFTILSVCKPASRVIATLAVRLTGSRKVPCLEQTRTLMLFTTETLLELSSKTIDSRKRML